VLEAVLEAVLDFIVGSVPENRAGRVIATIVFAAGIVATGVVIYLALSGKL
jgi:hypothetical protein